jgi:hypothetical protein
MLRLLVRRARPALVLTGTVRALFQRLLLGRPQLLQRDPVALEDIARGLVELADPDKQLEGADSRDPHATCQSLGVRDRLLGCAGVALEHAEPLCREVVLGEQLRNELPAGARLAGNSQVGKDVGEAIGAHAAEHQHVLLARRVPHRHLHGRGPAVAAFAEQVVLPVGRAMSPGRGALAII